MNAEEIVIRKSVVNTVLKVAYAYVDTERKGWRVKMRQFNDAMDDMGISSKEVRAVLAFLEVRMYVITFLDADSGIVGFSLVPQQYRCSNCNMLLDMQSDIRLHFGDCWKRQQKTERNRKLA